MFGGTVYAAAKPSDRKTASGALLLDPGESALGRPQPYMPRSRQPVSAGQICCNVGLGGESGIPPIDNKTTFHPGGQQGPRTLTRSLARMAELKGNFGFIGKRDLEI